MERSLFKPFLSIVVVMGLSVLALAFAGGVHLDFVPGVKTELPGALDGWTGNELRFCHNQEKCAKDYADASFYVSQLEIPDICPVCGEKLYNMSYAEWDALPKDTEFVKSAYTNGLGDRVFTSIVLSGKARDSIHRPQRCLKGQGNSINKEYTLEVPLDGRKPLKVAVILCSRMLRTQEGEVPYYSYYAYWFVGQNRETASHYERMFWLAWDRVVHSKANRWAYISVSAPREETGTAYEAQIKSFVKKMYPYILTDAFKAQQ